MLERMKKKLVNCSLCQYVMAVFSFGMVFAGTGMTALASSNPSTPSSASLSDTLDIFSEVFGWFLQEGGNLLSWMLDKPIILLSLAIFFVGAVVGVLARIYSSF